MRADDGGEVFLAAEGSAGLGLDDAAFFCGQVEDEFEGVDEVVGALHRALDFYRSGDPVDDFALGDDAVVLDIELFLGAGAVLAFDDVVGGGEDVVEVGRVPGLHQIGLEGVFFGRELWLGLGAGSAWGGGGGLRLVGGGSGGGGVV